LKAFWAAREFLLLHRDAHAPDAGSFSL
jgi:hypothetical protein